MASDDSLPSTGLEELLNPLLSQVPAPQSFSLNSESKKLSAADPEFNPRC